MQVSQQADHITHAVIGQQESIAMGVSDDAALMHILSSTLYTYPRLAMVRETICNGWDAHINAGLTQLPLDIVCNGGVFSVRDHGAGIPHDKIGSIYGVYGNSTKRDDSTVTGGFGLGSKAPFAYTDNFEVTSCCEGVKTVYRVSKSSMEKGGKPSINKIVSVPTEETGITVKVNIDPHHEEEFRRLVQEVLILGEIQARVNGQEPVQVLPLSQSPTGYVINTFTGTLSSRVNLRYGNVVYPVPMHESYKEALATLQRTMDGLWYKTNVIFMAPPDSISIAPNREAIILTDMTIKTVIELLGMYNPTDLAKAQVTCAEVTRAAVNQAIYREPAKKAFLGLVQPDQHRPQVDLVANRRGEELYAFTLRKASLIYLLDQDRGNLTDREITLKRLRQLIRLGQVEKPFAKALLKAAHRTAGNHHYMGIHGTHPMMPILSKFITYPLYQRLDQEKKLLKRERLLFARAAGYNSVELLPFKKLDLVTINRGLAYLDKRVLLARNKTAAMDWLSRRSRHNGETREGYLVYLVTSREETVTKAEQVFTDLGYAVSKHLPETEAQPVCAEDAEPKTRKPAAPRRKGYLTLAQSWNPVEKTFLLSTAREKAVPGQGIQDPVAWVTLNNKSEGAFGFRYLGSETCQAIHQLWGERIAVVTAVQADTLIKQGVPEVTAYVAQHVDEALSSAKDFPRYLAFAKEVGENAHYDKLNKILRHMVKHEDLMRTLGLRFHLSAQTEMLLTFYTRTWTSTDDRMKYLPQCQALAEKVKDSGLAAPLRQRMVHSPWRQFLNMDELGNVLQSAAPGSQAAKIACELTLNLLKHEA